MIGCLRSFNLVKSRVAATHPAGCPRSSFVAVAVRDCQLRRITKSYKDAQNRLLRRDMTCLACTWLSTALLSLLNFALDAASPDQSVQHLWSCLQHNYTHQMWHPLVTLSVALIHLLILRSLGQP